MSVRPVEPIVLRARAEYLEMPGLCLTEAQARRLWHLDQVACRHVLATLVEGGFLRQTSRGEYIRAYVGLPATDALRAPGTDGR